MKIAKIFEKQTFIQGFEMVYATEIFFQQIPEPIHSYIEKLFFMLESFGRLSFSSIISQQSYHAFNAYL